MTNDNNAPEINRTDLLVSAAKSIVGVAPFAGPLLAELVGTFIPNQRIDRLTKYVYELDNRLSRFKEDFLREEIKKDECIDLFEEGFRQAARALSDERRQYIAAIIENGVDNEEISYIETKHLLQLLESLNDAEVIWLRFYLNPEIGGDMEFREKHSNILDPVAAHIGSSQTEIDKEALQSGYTDHLERLNLIKAHYRIDRKTGMPEFDSSSGKQKVSYYTTTILGDLLLRFIGLHQGER